jgi:hypothetical protein
MDTARSGWVWILVGGGLLAIAGARSASQKNDVGFVAAGGSLAGGPSCMTTGATTATFVQGGSYTGATDATLTKATPDTNDGSSASCVVDAGPTSERSCALRWSLTGIPTTATVLGACAILQVYSGSTKYFPVFALKQRWTQSGVTWNNVSSSVFWQTPGAKGSNDREANPFNAMYGSTIAHQVDIPVEVVQSWLADSNQNFGIIIASDSNTDGISIRSSEHSVMASRPKLIVRYQ